MAPGGESQNIDLAVAGRFHAFHLAAALAKFLRLRSLYTAHPRILPPPGLHQSGYHNRIDLAAWTALSRLGNIGYSGERKSVIFDKWLARRLSREAPGILHSWNGSSLNTFKALKGSGWLLCVERSCPHNGFQYKMLTEEGNELGIPHRQDMHALENALEELDLADIIVAPSSYSARSYSDAGQIEKLRVNPLGGNVKYKERSGRNSGDTFRILMVGNSFLRKGTHYLVEAMKFIPDADAELWIRGDVPDEYRRRIKDSRVKIFPPLSRDRLDNLYLSADVFVQPSIDEGFGMTVLEALGYGLPLVVTDHVGAADLLNEQVSVKVPIRSARALAEGIQAVRFMANSRFDVARAEIIRKYTWEACAQRMIDDVYSKPRV